MIPTMATARLSRYFDDYTAFHRNPGNHLCHALGVPLIMFSLLGLLSHWVIGEIRVAELPTIRINCGILLWALSALWYLWLDWRIAIPFSLFSLGFYWTGHATSLTWLWVAMGVGWAFQLVGHSVYEKNRPALLKNLLHILIAPVWIFAHWVGYPTEISVPAQTPTK